MRPSTSLPSPSGHHAPSAQAEPRPLTLPPALLRELTRPIADLGDVERLLAQLDCARARGCF
jgi:hypothetical protein